MEAENYGLPDPEDVRIARELEEKDRSKLEQKRNVEHLARLVKAFELALGEAEEFADEHGLSFSIYPTYGMGGYYEQGEWNSSSTDC